MEKNALSTWDFAPSSRTLTTSWPSSASSALRRISSSRNVACAPHGPLDTSTVNTP